MWSDRPSEKRRERLAGRLRAILPPPRPGSRGSKTPLRVSGPKGPPRPEQVAEEMRGEPGFSWLDGGDSDHRLYVRPLATLAVRNGRASVSGPCGRATFAASGFDLLDAAFAAWGEAEAGATLVGYLGYEMGGELESLPPPPEDDLGLPDLHLSLYADALRWDGRSWMLEATDAWREPAAPDPVIASERLLAAARRRSEPEIPNGLHLHGKSVISRPNRGGFEAAVTRIVERIASGEIFQMNLCRRLETELPASSLWPLYQRLRAASPAEHGAFLDLGKGTAVLSISPELFLAVRGREVESRADQGHPAARRQPAGGPGARPRAAGEREGPRRADDDRRRGPQRSRAGLRDRQRRGGEPRRADDPADAPSHRLDRARAPAAGRGPVRRCSAPPSPPPRSPARRRSRRWPPSPPRRSGGAARRWEPWGGSRSAGIWSWRWRSAPPRPPRGRIAYHAGCGIVADSDPELEFAESAAKARAFLSALGAREPG